MACLFRTLLLVSSACTLTRAHGYHGDGKISHEEAGKMESGRPVEGPAPMNDAIWKDSEVRSVSRKRREVDLTTKDEEVDVDVATKVFDKVTISDPKLDTKVTMFESNVAFDWKINGTLSNEKMDLASKIESSQESLHGISQTENEQSHEENGQSEEDNERIEEKIEQNKNNSRHRVKRSPGQSSEEAEPWRPWSMGPWNRVDPNITANLNTAMLGIGKSPSDLLKQHTSVESEKRSYQKQPKVGHQIFTEYVRDKELEEKEERRQLELEQEKVEKLIKEEDEKRRKDQKEEEKRRKERGEENKKRKPTKLDKDKKYDLLVEHYLKKDREKQYRKRNYAWDYFNQVRLKDSKTTPLPPPSTTEMDLEEFRLFMEKVGRVYDEKEKANTTVTQRPRKGVGWTEERREKQKKTMHAYWKSRRGQGIVGRNRPKSDADAKKQDADAEKQDANAKKRATRKSQKMKALMDSARKKQRLSEHWNDEEEEEESEQYDEEEEEENEKGEEDVGDSKGHKKSLKKLKNMDPEFYKYLQQNDKELLDFEASSDEDDGDDKDKDVHKPPEELEGHSDESDFEEDATGGEYVEDGTVRKVTLAMVSKWRGDLQTKGKPLQTIAIVTKAFHAALYRILEEEDDQPVKFKVEGGGIFNAVVQLCVVELKPAILRLLKLPADSAKISVESNKMWPRVKALLKHYMMDLIKLLGAVSSPDIVSVLLKHLHGMLMFLPVLAFNSKPLLRQLVALWSKSDDEPVRIIAFLNLLRVTVNNKRKYLETVLKYMYTSYVANSKFVSHATLPNINFMRSSLAEMFSLDESVAYTHAFLYIRQLAIHLRNAITLHSKQAYQTVYNWQYVAALKLWTSLLTTSYANDKKQLSSLLYPLVQVIIGVIKLIPTSTYFPLRFHCVDLLNQISSETGLFIPTAPLILEIFQIYDLNKRHSKVSMKPLDFTCILRLNKIHLVENGFKTSVVDCVYQHLLNYMQNESSRISFPDLCIPVVSQLRAFVKASKVPNYSRKIKQLLDKIEDTSRFVEEERRKAALPLSNRDGIKTWEGAVKAKGTPLMSFYAAWKKINDQREAKKFTDNETMADFKLPTLKKQVPKAKKPRTEEDGQVDLFPSDDEDDDIGFGADSEEEEEEEEAGSPAVLDGIITGTSWGDLVAVAGGGCDCF
uniref:Nucleolar complex protein 2 homolog n=1 Tax=Cacopsylla melanoneura TaxID=428564 RepID=A0A8D8YF06_9HEMI